MRSSRAAGSPAHVQNASYSDAPAGGSAWAGKVSRSPEIHSIARNCTDWKPDAGASGSRNSRKPSGPMVSSTSRWSSSSRSTASTRRSAGAAACGRPASSASRAATSSCRMSLNHSS